MKPNFALMPTPELRAYVRRNWDDWEALDVLVSRRSPDLEATWYGPMATKDGVPIEENIRLAEEGIQEEVKLDRERESNREIIDVQMELLDLFVTEQNKFLTEQKNKINQESPNQ